MTIWFDMDGTIVDLYGVEGWLDKIHAEDVSLFDLAKPYIEIALFEKMVQRVQAKGYKVGIISWTPMGTSVHYNEAVAYAKRNYLKKNFPTIQFDEINIIAYGTPKSSVAKENDILFDDEEKNRTEWKGQAYTEKEIFKVLKNILDK